MATCVSRAAGGHATPPRSGVAKCKKMSRTRNSADFCAPAVPWQRRRTPAHGTRRCRCVSYAAAPTPRSQSTSRISPKNLSCGSVVCHCVFCAARCACARYSSHAVRAVLALVAKSPGHQSRPAARTLLLFAVEILRNRTTSSFHLLHFLQLESRQ